MKRKLLAVLMAASMTVTMAACGSANTEGNSQQPTVAETAKVESNQTEAVKPEEGNGEKEKTANFEGVKIELDIGEELREGITVFQDLVKQFCEETGAQVEIVTNGNDHEAVMKTRMASQDMPDMWSTHGWGVLRYGDFAADLSGEKWVDRMEPSVRAVVTDKNGKVDTCPLTQWVYGIAFNKAVFDAHNLDPYEIKTWDDLFAACKTLKEAGITPFCIGTQGGNNLAGLLEISNAFYSIETAPYRDTEALENGTFDWSKNTHLLEKLAEIYDNGWFNEDIFTLKSVTAQQYLGTGDYGMMLWGSPGFVTTAKTYYPEGDFGLIPIPAVEEGGNAVYTVGEGTAIAISKDTKNPEVCKALLDYLTDPEVLVAFINKEGSIPGFNDVIPDNTEIMDLYQKSVEKAGDKIEYSNFFDREWLPSGMWNTMQETVVLIFNGDVGSAKGRVEEAAKYMQESYVALWDSSK